MKDNVKSASWGAQVKAPKGDRSLNLYRSYRWRKFSKRYKEDHPLCANCKRVGLTILSKVSDHIIGVKVFGAIWDTRNLQALCRSCDGRKRNMERLGTYIIKSGLNEDGELIPAEDVKHF